MIVTLGGGKKFKGALAPFIIRRNAEKKKTDCRGNLCVRGKDGDIGEWTGVLT